MSTKNWPKVSSKEKLVEVKGERERDSLRFAEDSIFIFLQLNGLNNKSNYKNRKTNYTKIEKWTKTSPKLAKKMTPRITITKMASYSPTFGRCVMKSRDTLSQGLVGTGRGSKSPETLAFSTLSY